MLGAEPVPSRLGVTPRIEDGELVLDLTPRPEVLHHGVVRASVLSFAIDAVAGHTGRRRPRPLDPHHRHDGAHPPDAGPRPHHREEPDPPAGPPIGDQQGGADDRHRRPGGAGAIGFAHIPRKECDPPKPSISPS